MCYIDIFLSHIIASQLKNYSYCLPDKMIYRIFL